MISEREPSSPNNNIFKNFATFPDNATFVAINAIYIYMYSVFLKGRTSDLNFLTLLMKLNKLFLLHFIVV